MSVGPYKPLGWVPDAPLTVGALDESISKPPPGGKRVTNLYVNEEGKLVVEYDETPVP